MANLEYSPEALSNKSLFYNKKISVYVEGEDDILFWNSLFEIANFEAHIEDVGGKNELKKYINSIIYENSDFVVATDLDYLEFLFKQKKISHNRIVTTYGHSIENTMYCFQKINKIISNLSRKKINIVDEIEEWAHSFTNDVFELIIYDIANERYNKGVSVLPNACNRFLINNNSISIDKNEVETKIQEIYDSFIEIEINSVKRLRKKIKKENWYIIRGHFLTNAIINYIKKRVFEFTGKLPNGLSKDILYGFTIDCNDNWKNRKDVIHMVDAIKSIGI